MLDQGKVDRTAEKGRCIDLIYDESCSENGERIGEWLVSSGIAAEDSAGEVRRGGFVRRSYTARHDISADSAIVFVSDEATEDQHWQDHVRALPEDNRIIPVGGIERADYSDPLVMPSRIEEINFIRADEEMTGNILNSLTTDPAFYALKNHLMAKYGSWQISHHKSTLMSDKKRIKEYTEIIEKRLVSEEDEAMREQLSGISEYLAASGKNARRMFAASLAGRLTRILPALGILLVMVIAMITIVRVSLSDINHSLLKDTNINGPAENAIMMAGIIGNPNEDDISKDAAYYRLVYYLGKAWEQTPLGVSYNQLLFDACIPSGSQYLYTCTSGGRVLLWDTYTGEIVSKSPKLTEGHLTKMALSPDESVITALDTDGAIYMSCDRGKNWQNAAHTSTDTYNSELRMTDDGLIVFDGSSVELFRIDRENYSLISIGDQRQQSVIDAGFSDDGSALLLYSRNGLLYSVSLNLGGAASKSSQKEVSYDVLIDEEAPSDMRDGKAVLSDIYGQIWTVKDGKASRTSLALDRPLALRWVDGHTVVYNDRNVGTGLYDLRYSFDYGDVLDGFDVADDIDATDELIVMNCSYIYESVAAGDILYRPTLPDEVSREAAVYRDRDSSADFAIEKGKASCCVRITDDGILLFSADACGKKTTIAFDPALVMNNAGGLTTDEEKDALADDVEWNAAEPFTADGLPAVAGMRVPEDDRFSSEPYCVFVTGCSDGSFAEFVIFLESGEYAATSVFRTPSRSAVTAIYFSEGTYWLEDAEGRYWKVSSGEDLVSTDGIMEHVKGKLHRAVGNRVKSYIPRKVWRALDLRMQPGGDGRDWE